MSGNNERNGKIISHVKVITLISLITFLITLSNIFILSTNLNSIANLDILYTSRNSEFVFTNTTGRVETVQCNDALECLGKLESISKRAMNVISYSSIYNFTAIPINSISHYIRNTIYLSLSFLVIVFILLFVSSILIWKVESTLFF